MFNDSYLEKICEMHVSLTPEIHKRLTKEHISKIIEAVFFSSLKFEEGQKILPRVFVALDEKFLYKTKPPILRFTSPQKLTPDWLRKFTLSMSTARSTFLVSFNDEIPYVFGISHEQWKASSENHVVRGEGAILITATDVGVVSVSMGAVKLGTFRDGSFMGSESDIFKDAVFKQCAITALDIKIYSPDKQKSLLSELQILVRMVSELKQGGTIVVIQNNNVSEAMRYLVGGKTVQIEHLDNGFGAIPTGYADSTLSSKNTASMDPNRRRYFQFLAQLSAIDGALIINEKFEPLMIGAKLNASQYSGQLLMGGRADNLQPIDSKTVGTRHTSAQNFVAADKKCLAFVISSDGPVSVIAPSDDGLAMWRNAINA